MTVPRGCTPGGVQPTANLSLGAGGYGSDLYLRPLNSDNAVLMLTHQVHRE
jgi:hypothetical protein